MGDGEPKDRSTEPRTFIPASSHHSQDLESNPTSFAGLCWQVEDAYPVWLHDVVMMHSPFRKCFLSQPSGLGPVCVPSRFDGTGKFNTHDPLSNTVSEQWPMSCSDMQAAHILWANRCQSIGLSLQIEPFVGGVKGPGRGERGGPFYTAGRRDCSL